MICIRCGEFYETENSEVRWVYESGCDVKLSRCPYCEAENTIQKTWLSDYKMRRNIGSDVEKYIKDFKED